MSDRFGPGWALIAILPGQRFCGCGKTAKWRAEVPYRDIPGAYHIKAFCCARCVDDWLLMAALES